MTSTKQLVDRLRTVSVHDAFVISLYVGLAPDPGERGRLEARVHSLLEPVRQRIDSALIGRTARLALRADLQRIEALVPELRTTRGRGVALFTCDRLRLDERAVLPHQVRDRAVVDRTPWLRPLLAVLDEPRRYGVVIVDREETWLYVVSTGELQTASRIRHQARSGGDGRRRPPGTTQTEERARHHCRDTSERVTLLVRMGKVDLLVVGGRTETVDAFLRSLPLDVREKVAGTFDSHDMTAGQVRQQAQQVIDAYERDRERRLVAEALDRVGKGALATLGLPWCLDAVNARAVQLLLADIDHEVAGVVCTRCGWLGIARPPRCQRCGGPLRGTPDVVDEAVGAVVDAGGEVEHVTTETPLRQHVVATLTRFPVPPPA